MAKSKDSASAGRSKRFSDIENEATCGNREILLSKPNPAVVTIVLPQTLGDARWASESCAAVTAKPGAALDDNPADGAGVMWLWRN